MATTTLDKKSRLSRQPSVEDVEDDHYRQARLRRAARDASSGGWRYTKTLHVEDSERNVRSDLASNTSLYSGECAVGYQRPETGSGVNLIVQSDNEEVLERYTSKLRTHYTSASKPSQQYRYDRRGNKLYDKLFKIKSKTLRVDDVEKDLSAPELTPKGCQVDVARKPDGIEITIISNDERIINSYFRKLQEFYAHHEPASNDLQEALLAQLLPDYSNLSQLISRGLKISGTGLPDLARQHRDESLDRIANNPVRNPLPRRPSLAASNSGDASPASNGSMPMPKTAQIDNFQQTIRLQGYYKGDLTKDKAKAWLESLSGWCKKWPALTGVTIVQNQDVGNTMSFSGTNTDLNKACKAIKRYLLEDDPARMGKWLLKSAENTLDVYEWCPAPPPPSSRAYADRRPSLRPDDMPRRPSVGIMPQRPSVNTVPQRPFVDTLPRRASVQATELQLPPRRPSMQQPAALDNGPSRKSSVRHVSSEEVQKLFPPRRASSAIKSASNQPRKKQPLERTVHVYDIDPHTNRVNIGPPSTADSDSTRDSSVFTKSSRASTFSSANSAILPPGRTPRVTEYTTRRVVTVEPQEMTSSVTSSMSAVRRPSRSAGLRKTGVKGVLRDDDGNMFQTRRKTRRSSRN